VLCVFNISHHELTTPLEVRPGCPPPAALLLLELSQSLPPLVPLHMDIGIGIGTGFSAAPCANPFPASGPALYLSLCFFFSGQVLLKFLEISGPLTGTTTASACTGPSLWGSCPAWSRKWGQVRLQEDTCHHLKWGFLSFRWC